VKSRPRIGEVGELAIPTDMRHLAPTPVGQTIHCTARVIAVEGSKVSFQIEARDAHEVIVRGSHKRAVIKTDSFARRVNAKSG
jgi:predicted thioesterase